MYRNSREMKSHISRKDIAYVNIYHYRNAHEVKENVTIETQLCKK